MNKKEIKYYVAVCLIALLVALSCNAFGNQQFYTDSGVFQYVAMEMQQGKMPYLDTFDHKGPLIYVINFLGRMISQDFGLWLFELTAIAVALLYSYRIARLCVEPLPSLFAVGLLAFPLVGYLQAGNFSEEYALPLITISLYIFLEYFIAGNSRKRDVFWCGACFGGVLLLRPNMIAVWIAGCILVLIDCIREKAYQQLLGFLGAFLLGTGVIVMPFVLWLYAAGALKAAIESYILFNMKYSGFGVSRAGLLGAFEVVVLQYVPILSALGILLMAFDDRSEKFFMIALSWVLSVLLIVMPGKDYDHYGIILIPAMIYPVAYLYSWFFGHFSMKSSAVSLALAALLFIGVMPGLLTFTKSVIKPISYLASASEEGAKADPVVALILEKTTPKDRISVYGNADHYYLLSNRMSASRYSYQDPIEYVDPNVSRCYLDDLEANNPKVIVWPGIYEEDDAATKSIYAFIREHGYVQDSIEKCVFYLP